MTDKTGNSGSVANSRIFDEAPTTARMRDACDEALRRAGLVTIERIRAATPLASLLPETAANGECPWCFGERFYIDPAGDLFACPDCGEQGDVIDAFQSIEGVDFRTAVERLADRAKASQ